MGYSRERTMDREDERPFFRGKKEDSEEGVKGKVNNHFFRRKNLIRKREVGREKTALGFSGAGGRNEGEKKVVNRPWETKGVRGTEVIGHIYREKHGNEVRRRSGEEDKLTLVGMGRVWHMVAQRNEKKKRRRVRENEREGVGVQESERGSNLGGLMCVGQICKMGYPKNKEKQREKNRELENGKPLLWRKTLAQQTRKEKKKEK